MEWIEENVFGNNWRFDISSQWTSGSFGSQSIFSFLSLISQPGNILVRLKGINSISSVHISDFGTAKRMEEKYEPLQGSVGTPEYMSPEMEEGRSFDPFAADGKELEEELIW